ncbi:uncharacterized protein TM35_000112230, partial [Trypanosoma theileri]
MRLWCSTQHASRYMYVLRRDLISTRNLRHSPHTALWQLRRMSISHSSMLDAENGAVMNNNHNSATSPPDDSPSVEVNLSHSIMSSSLSKAVDSKEKNKSNDNNIATDSWDLNWMLFSLKDNRTGVISCPDAEDRLRGMVLLDAWMIEKMFLKSGWLNQLQKNGESAPQYRSVVGEYKVLRYLLHRFLSDETLWCDELQELLQIILERGMKYQHNAIYSTDSNMVSSYSCKGDDSMVSIKVPQSLRSGPENMNFYSEGLQRVLWKFLQLRESSLDTPDAVWCAFVATHRNALFLPSPQRPPFDHCEQVPYLSETEFVDVLHEEEEEGPIVNEALEHTETLMQGVTLNWPSEWKLENDTPNGHTNYSVEGTQKVGNEQQRHQYQHDAFYMNLVEPNELDFYDDSSVRNTPTDTTSLVSQNVDESQQEEEKEKEKHVSGWHSSRLAERGLLNPVNGELEDLHLTHLWDVFQGNKMEDIIDLYRGVCGKLETLQEEVFLDSLARKGLLLLFFARDEVRALTPPSVTYQRLRYLHNELNMLVSWYYPYNGSNELKSPHSFEELSHTSQLSFSCFAHLHTPLQRDMYRISSPATSPAQLYHHYCTLYSQDGEKGKLYTKQDTANEVKITKGDALESHDTVTMGRFPMFELLSEFQQMAFQYPFGETFHSRVQTEPVLDSTLSQSAESTPKNSFKEETLVCDNRESSVVVKKRLGRPKKDVGDSSADETQEPVVEAKKRLGRPKKDVEDSGADETQEPVVEAKKRLGRP